MGEPDRPAASSDAGSSTSGPDVTHEPGLDDRRPLDVTGPSLGGIGLANTLAESGGFGLANTLSAQHASVSISGMIAAPLASGDRYEILQPLGQGGMGSVVLARDLRLGRLVALKFLRLPSPEAVERMMQEARAQARLDHKGICKVFEVGDFNGQPYIAMEYLKGQPLNAALRPLTLEQKVVLLIDVALAVHAAHSQGVLHRDLKPANIMVCTADAGGEAGEAGELRPVLLDFGLARDSLTEQRLTRTGMIMGTPQYMAPEQARGNARNLDRRADIYSLGAILYELLTGRPPFTAGSEVELLLALLEQDPTPPRLLEPGLPADLEVITLKCLCREPERRYESALALADDLRRYLRGEPITARPASRLYRLRRLAARHLAVVVVCAVILCSLAALLGVTLHARARERAAADQADRQQRLAGELGQSLASMNLFLRVAYSLPVHDLEREQREIRQELDELEAQSPEIDEFLRGTLEGAIGSGYLALHDDRQAVAHLQRALASGNTSPEIHLALGQALGRLHDGEAREVRRRLQGEQAQARLAELREQYLAPALAELELGRQSPRIEPLYVEALIHYYRGDSEHELALQAAREAHEAAPWAIEPLDLEARILSQRGLAQLLPGNLDAIEQVEAIRDSLERAIGIARSYPDFYSSLVEVVSTLLRVQGHMNLKLEQVEPLFAVGLHRAQQAIELLPNNLEAYDQLAELLAQWANVQAEAGQDPRATIEQALAAVDNALARPPERARSYFARARASMARATYQVLHDEDALPTYEQTIADCRRAAALDPDHRETWIVLTMALREKAESKLLKGLPADQEFDEIEHAGKRAIELASLSLAPRSNLADLYILRAREDVRHGRDPSAYLTNARQLLDEVLTKNPEHMGAQLNRLMLHQEELHYLLTTDQDATGATVEARENVAEAERLTVRYPALAYAFVFKVEAYAALADALLAQGASPLSALQDGLATVDSVAAVVLPAGKQQQLRGDLLLRQAAWLTADGQSPEPALQAILGASAQLDRLTGAMQSELLAQRARALRLRAAWQMSRRQARAALASIDAGLAVCATVQATARAGLLQCKMEEGILQSLKAQLVRSPAEREALTTRSAATLRALVAEQPPLERELGRYISSSISD